MDPVLAPKSLNVEVRGRRVSVRASDAMWERPQAIARLEDGGCGQEPRGMGGPTLEVGKGKTTGSPLEPPGRNACCQYLDFSPGRPIMDFWPPEFII